MEKARLKKKYKRLRWIQFITFIASVIACVFPVVLSCIKAAPTVEKTGGKWALGGIAVFFSAIILLIVFRSLVNKFVSKVPYTLVVLVSVGAVMLLIYCLKQIVDDAIAILAVGIIGAAAGFVLELVSIYCKTVADDIEICYKRGKYDEV